MRAVACWFVVGALYGVFVAGCSGQWAVASTSVFPHFWDGVTWESAGQLDGGNLAALGGRHPIGPDGVYTFKFEAWEGDLDGAGEPDHYTIWSQQHDPFTETTDGSDYEFIEGDEPATCGGFNGLHSLHFEEGAASGIRHARASDVDEADHLGCWSMQVVPIEEYQGIGAYLDGYDGELGTHVRQELSIRL